MTPLLHQVVLAAAEGVEGVSADHIAAKLAVPLGIVIFCGSVFALLWSNYGAKKGALIYGVSLGGFCFMLGIFWWFGAPGTPVATGLTNFPGQAADEYSPAWFPFEPGSERADMFDTTASVGADADSIPDGFQTLRQSLGLEDASAEDLEGNPRYNAENGDLNGAGSLMTALFLRESDGSSQLGGERRQAYTEAAEAELADMGVDLDDVTRDDPYYSAAIDGEIQLGSSGDVPLAAALITASVNYLDADGEAISIPVDTQVVFAFKQESNLWFPSAVWTGVFFLIFVVCLLALDRMEQKEKGTVEEAEEPERLAVPINQGAQHLGARAGGRPPARAVGPGLQSPSRWPPSAWCPAAGRPPARTASTACGRACASPTRTAAPRHPTPPGPCSATPTSRSASATSQVTSSS